MPRIAQKKAEETVLVALACGATVENAARKAGLCERTVYRWLTKPEFKERLKQISAELVKRTAGMLTGAAMGSMKVLFDLQNDMSVPAAVRRRAARDVLELGIRFRENADLEERLLALEDRLSQTRPTSSPPESN
jgi:hypothetical protein